MTDEKNAFEPSPLRQADLDLVDALMRAHALLDVEDRRADRIGRVLASIRGNASPAPYRATTSAPTRSFAAAAALLVATTLIWLLGGHPRTAMASVSDVLTALQRIGDRTYRLAVDPPDGGGRFSLHDAWLHLRDGTQFLLIRNDSRGHRAIDGFDGERSFRIRDGILVEDRVGTGAGRIPLPARMSELPFHDLEQALAGLETDYAIEEFGPVPDGTGGRKALRLLAQRRTREAKGPAAIEILADPITGMPRRIVFDRAKFQGSADPRRLTLDLVSEQALDAGFFTPEFHRSPR